MPAVSISTSFLLAKPSRTRRSSRGVLGDVHRRAQDPREVDELLARADAVRVGAHEPELLDAVAQHEARRDLRDARRLADAGGPDDREHAAVDRPCPRSRAASARRSGARRSRMRFLESSVGRHLVGELGRERRVDAELRELAQQPRAHGRFAIQVVPREARELRLEQAAQILDLERHRRLGRSVDPRRALRLLGREPAAARASRPRVCVALVDVAACS